MKTKAGSTTEDNEDFKAMEAREARIAELEAENARLKASSKDDIFFKVSEKGAVSVYRLGRFPVTLYKGQWRRLIDKIEALGQFIEDHEDELAVKE